MATIAFDPKQLAVDSIAGEAALDAVRLTPDWLRQRLAAQPDWQPEITQDFLSARAVPVRAAVLIPLVQRPQGLTILLTMRTDHLSSHAGPGQLSRRAQRSRSMPRPSPRPCAKRKKKWAWRASTSKCWAACPTT